jgi:chromosome segregation ATPase
MHDYKRAIGDLQKAIAKNSAEIRENQKKLGEYLSYKEAEILPDPAMKELHGRIQELRRQLPESRQQVKKILQTVAGNEALEREIRAKRQQIGALTKNNEEICQSIGRAAYLAYQSLPDPGKENEQLFESLEKQEQGLAELEAEQEALQERGRGGKFFKIFRESGRSVYLKGLLSLRRKAVEKTYHELGGKICDSPELKAKLEGARLRETLVPYEANERKIGAVQRELDRLLEDQGKKWSDLKSLGAHRSHQKRVREIESEIQSIEAKMQDGFEALGTLFRNKRNTELQDPEAAGLIRRMLETEQDTRKKEKRIERLRAALQIDSLENQLGTLADRISRLEGDIELRRREVETLGRQIAAGQKEIQRLQKIRGSEHSLIEEHGS